MRWRRTAVAGAGMAAALLSGGLAPSTRPAPATPPVAAAKAPVPPPKDWVRVENKADHLHFFVPKTWEAGGVSDASAAYTIPKTYPGHASQFKVSTGPTPATTVADASDAVREALQEAVVAKGGRVNHDAAATLAGREAWSFEFQVPYTVPGPPRPRRRRPARSTTPGPATPASAPRPARR